MKHTITHYERELLVECAAIAAASRKTIERARAVVERVLLYDSAADELADDWLHELFFDGNLELHELLDRLGITVFDPLNPPEGNQS